MKDTRKVLFYDIETSLVKALLFRLGKQVVRHTQLLPRNQVTGIITIQYCWKHEKKGKVMLVDIHNPHEAIRKFDALIREADVVIGKNNNRFDDKHINMHRLLDPASEGMPEWVFHKSDDLEKQFRKHFNMLSYSLDYASELLGLGGKISMQFSDWVDIFCLQELQKIETASGKEAAKATAPILYSASYTEIMRKGKVALKKMTDYGAKDVEDTRDMWLYFEKHITPRFSHSSNQDGFSCKECGSTNLRKNGYYTSRAKVKYTQYYCKDHNGYAGKHGPKSTKLV